MSILATDNFNRADADPIGGNWTTGPSSGAMKIATNIATTSTGTDSAAYYNALAWPNDQYSLANITSVTAGGGAGPCVLVRMSAAAQTFYRVAADRAASGNVQLAKAVAGSFTTLWNRTATVIDGDILKLSAQQTSLDVYISGVAVGATATDSAITAGNTGIGYSSNDGGPTTVDNWEGGDFAEPSLRFSVDRRLRPRPFAPGLAR